MGGIMSTLGSILSSLAQNLLLPQNRRLQQQQHNEKSSQRIQIVVVDQQPGQPTQTCLLEIAEGEDTIYTINYGPRGNMIPLAVCHGMFLSVIGCPERLAIWNPTTSNKTILPQSSVPHPPRMENEFVLTYGFGFDPSSNDYKVIRFLEFEFEDGRDSKLVELYSLKTNSWKQIAYPHGDVGYGSDPVCVYTKNGFCYCRTSDDHLFFIPFDLANDYFPSALIPGPPNICRSSFAPVVFEGSLAVIAYQYKPFEFELWVWNNNYESWSLRGSWANIGGTDIGYSPRGLFFDNGVLFLQNSKDELVLFDCAKQTFKVLGVYEDPCVYVFPYNACSS